MSQRQLRRAVASDREFSSRIAGRSVRMALDLRLPDVVEPPPAPRPPFHPDRQQAAHIPKPQRLRTAYSYFVKDNYARTRMELKTRTPQPIIKRIGERWHALTENEMRMYGYVSTFSFPYLLPLTAIFSARGRRSSTLSRGEGGMGPPARRTTDELLESQAKGDRRPETTAVSTSWMEYGCPGLAILISDRPTCSPVPKCKRSFAVKVRTWWPKNEIVKSSDCESSDLPTDGSCTRVSFCFRWRALDSEAREKYKRKAEADKVRFLKDLQVFQSGQRANVIDRARQRVEQLQAEQLRQQQAEPNRAIVQVI